MQLKHCLIVLGLLAVCLIVAIEAAEDTKQSDATAKVDKQSQVAKKKLQQAKTVEPVPPSKLRVARSLAAGALGKPSPSNQPRKQGDDEDLMTAAHEKKYKLVKKKPKHKKVKMEVFEPKMKYKKIKMKIPVKKMKKKKVKGYLVKKEHHHHEY